MKVLFLCVAFAAVSLAMPVAEEKIEPAVSPPVAALDDIAPTIESKKSEPASLPEIKEPGKAPEPEGKSAKPEENVAKAAAPAEPEAEKKPESSEPAESKPEAENKPADELKQPGESDGLVKEIPNDAAAAVPQIDVVSAVKSNANIAPEPVVIDGLIPSPERRIDLLVVPSMDEVVLATKKDDAVLPAGEAAKPEETKLEEIKPIVKAEEKSAEVAPAASTETKPVAETSDALRVVRDTVDDAVKPKVEEAKETEKKEEAAPTLETVAKDSEVAPEAKPEDIEKPTQEAELADQSIPNIQPEPIKPEAKNTKVDLEKPEEPKADAAKEESKKEDPKTEVPKKEEPEKKDPKEGDLKNEDPKKVVLKEEDPKKQQLQQDEPKPEIPDKIKPVSSEESDESSEIKPKPNSSESSEEGSS